MSDMAILHQLKIKKSNPNAVAKGAERHSWLDAFVIGGNEEA